MIDKRANSLADAVADLRSGMTVMVSGFGGAGVPRGLIAAVLAHGPRDLTVISNNCGFAAGDLTDWLEAGLVAKMICSYPRTSPAFVELFRAGKIGLELVPQGTLAERIRCAGVGLGGFLSPVAAGTLLAEGKPTHTVSGRDYILEMPLEADMALVKGRLGDPVGNLTYNKTARNFGPAMAMAGRITVAEVDEVVEAGAIDPENVITPGAFVNRVVAGGTA